MIHFDAETHTYTDASAERVVPGVTRILSVLGAYENVPEVALERKRQIGSDVHAACHILNTGLLNEVTVSEEIAEYVRAYKTFLKDKQPVCLFSEMPMYSPDLGFAGTPDFVGEIDGQMAVFDIKTTVRIYPMSGLQLSAYGHLVQSQFDIKVAKRYTLQLKKDGSYVLFEHDSKEDFINFLACLRVYRFKEINV